MSELNKFSHCLLTKKRHSRFMICMSLRQLYFPKYLQIMNKQQRANISDNEAIKLELSTLKEEKNQLSDVRSSKNTTKDWL